MLHPESEDGPRRLLKKKGNVRTAPLRVTQGAHSALHYSTVTHGTLMDPK
jgi:hypothetical protein